MPQPQATPTGIQRSRDNSRSAKAFRLGIRMSRSGRSYFEFTEAVRTDPVTAEWFVEKGLPRDERELKRIWQVVTTLPATLPPTEDALAMLFAAQHADRLRYCHDTGRW
jgi:putative DNA primase/helicase